MAQKFIINKAPYNVEMIIDDNELTVYEFSEFWDKVLIETGVKIDTVTGQPIKLNVNRKLAKLLTTQLYKIEEEIPKAKSSKYDSKKQITKNVIKRFFENFIKLLNKAYSEGLSVGIEGE